MQSAKEQCERYLEHMRSPLGIISIFITSTQKKTIFVQMFHWKIMLHVMVVKQLIMSMMKLNVN